MFDGPVPHIEAAMHRIGPRADAAYKKPLEQNNLGHYQHDERCPDEWSRRQVKERPRHGIDVGQESDPRHHRAEKKDRKQEDERCIQHRE